MWEHVYPFSAIVGQDAMKKSLLLNIINPQIGGVLICGQKGTAKSTVVRSLANLSNCNVVNVPLSVTEDRLVGSIDLEQTLKQGRIQLEYGLLYQADEQVLYVDEVNLLQDSIVNVLLAVNASGVNHIERESLSYNHPSRFVLIGTMNQEEGELRPHFLDRFGLCVNVQAESDPNIRVEIVKRRMEYEKNAEIFCKKYLQKEEALKQRIFQAKERLKQICIADTDRQYIVNLCLSAHIQGHRGDFVVEQTAKTLAAFYGRTTVTREDMEEAAYLALLHRRKEKQPNPQEESQSEQPSTQEQEMDSTPPQQTVEDELQNKQSQNTETHTSETSSQNVSSTKTQYFRIGDDFHLKEFGHLSDKRERNGQGKRTNIRSAAKSGRYLYACTNQGKKDLALDATIRAAAPFQKYRDKKGKAISIYSQDIREKVRQKKMANILVFVVDASGSIGANQRMIETKGAVLSLLKDAYIKRDKVALIVFRGDSARVVLPPTRSVERGYRYLEELEVGGKTPLNAGINKGIQVIKSELKKDMNCMPMLIVITDGKGNISLDEHKKPKDELLEIGKKVKELSIANSMVIDIEKKGFMQFGIAKELANVMNATYYSVETLRKESILQMVESVREAK